MRPKPIALLEPSNVGRPAVQARKLVRLQRSTGVSRPCTSTPGNGGRLWRFRIRAPLSLRGFRRGPSHHVGFGHVVSILGCFTAFEVSGGFRCRGRSRSSLLTEPRVRFGQRATRSPRRTSQAASEKIGSNSNLGDNPGSISYAAFVRASGSEGYPCVEPTSKPGVRRQPRTDSGRWTSQDESLPGTEGPVPPSKAVLASARPLRAIR